MPMKKITILISIDAVNKYYLDNINSMGKYPIRQQSPDWTVHLSYRPIERLSSYRDTTSERVTVTKTGSKFQLCRFCKI